MMGSSDVSSWVCWLRGVDAWAMGSRARGTYDGQVTTTFLTAVGALVPSIGVFVLFWFAIRAIMRADRSEREALARFESEREGVLAPAHNAARRES